MVIEKSKLFLLAACASATAAFAAAPIPGEGEMLHRYVTPNTVITTNSWQAVSKNVTNVAEYAVIRLAQTNSVLNGGPYQEMLPYPTNSIPYSVIVDAPQMEADRITDGTNTIDAAGNVYSNGTFVGKVSLTNDIPPAVTVVAPSTNAMSGTAADAKATGTALYTGFTEWEFSDVPQGYSVKNVWYETQTPHGARWVVSYNEFPVVTMSDQTSRDATELTFEEYAGSEYVGMTATRHLITPTKTSQLTNDGPPSGDAHAGHPFATTDQIDLTPATNYASQVVARDATNYTDSAVIQLAQTNSVLSGGPYLPLTGGEMTGPLKTAFYSMQYSGHSIPTNVTFSANGILRDGLENGNVIASGKYDLNFPLTNGTLAVRGDIDAALDGFSTDQITDGTNTIDAAGGVYVSSMSPWQLNTNGIYAIDMFYDASNNWWTNSFEGVVFYITYEFGSWTLFGGEYPDMYGDGSEDSLSVIFNDTMFSMSRQSVHENKYVGKLALTNDIPHAVSVVAPSTNATEGTAADAKATGTALYTGFTEWEFSGVPDGITVESINYDSLNQEWELVLSDGIMFTNGGGSDTLLVFSSILYSITATRHLITPTKTSQLVNDGDGTNAFATVEQIPAPVDISGKLDGEAAYPAWERSPLSPYAEGDIVSHRGKLWEAGPDVGSDEPDLTESWTVVTLKYLKQDTLTFDNAPTQNSNNPVKSGGIYTTLQGKVSTNALANKPTYDFSKNYDIIRATADLVQLLGGTVTNNPTANIGGN